MDIMIPTSHMEEQHPVQSDPGTPTAPVSPITPQAARFSVSSMSSIPLSETDLDYDSLSREQVEQCLSTPRVTGTRHARKPSSVEILENPWAPSRQSTLFDMTRDDSADPSTPYSTDDRDMELHSEEGFHRQGHSSAATSPSLTKTDSVSSTAMGTLVEPKRPSLSSEESESEVDWMKLEKTEQQEKTDKDLPEGTVDESTAFLLARLEQENAMLTSDPKAVNKAADRARRKSRPPSMAHLRKLVSRTNDIPSVRYSVSSDVSAPEDPPAMTELEFWTALVQDYPSTAVRLPTLTSSKIRAGIPPPLRGVVWTSMSGARDRNLDRSFRKLVGERSPYEGIINKDVGRSFPGVELFRDADGEGQRMLGRVLKCYSLHDKDIGYCQGLGFLVGPLLMNMGEQESFCVLVRLMEHYSLRPSFLPSLSGLHMRIYQFSALLRQLLPELSEHLAELGVEPAYLSQWFLSCFAVTCPLPMLFRIYDVIFAEGANETVMRVALALMRRNEQTMLESAEFEEVMQLLLGRSIWESYACDADELVDDFTSLGNVITNGRLAELEKEFDSQSRDAVGEKAGFLPDVQAAASRFLGRLWAPSHTSQKSTSALSPPSTDKEAKGNFLLRSQSKQSISTLNESSSNDSTSSGSGSMASTAPTESELGTLRESTADSLGLKSKPDSMHGLSIQVPQTPGMSKEDRDLHTQIEDLLTALSGMQREHADLVAMLQREREERTEDHRVVEQLVGRLAPAQGNGPTSIEDRRRTMPAPPRETVPMAGRPVSQPPQSRDDLTKILEQVRERLITNPRHSANFETKAQLKTALTTAGQQLERAEARARDLTARVEEVEAIINVYSAESDETRVEVEELRRRVNDDFKERQKLEHTIRELQAQARSLERNSMSSRADSMTEARVLGLDELAPAAHARNDSVSSAPLSSIGLREFKLGRRYSVASVQSSRSTRFSQSTRRESLPQIPTSPSPPASVVAPSVEASSVAASSAAASSAAAPSVAVSSYAAPSIAAPSAAAPSAAAPSSAAPSSAAPSVAAPSVAAPKAVSPRPAALPAGLVVPTEGAFAPRTSSLATRAVLATPEHQPATEEAMLLELVNAKTSEAQARQEVDELRRSLAVQKRKQDEALRLAHAEAEAFRAQAEALREEAEKRAAEEAAEAAEAERKRLEAERSTVTTPSEELSALQFDTNADGSMSREAKTPHKNASAAGNAASWFWNRRTPSTTSAFLPAKTP